jgi:hypothetical protein
VLIPDDADWDEQPANPRRVAVIGNTLARVRDTHA